MSELQGLLLWLLYSVIVLVYATVRLFYLRKIELSGFDLVEFVTLSAILLSNLPMSIWVAYYLFVSL